MVSVNEGVRVCVGVSGGENWFYLICCTWISCLLEALRPSCLKCITHNTHNIVINNKVNFDQVDMQRLVKKKL